LSPEQTIIIAQSCNDYKKSGTFKKLADYIAQYDTCKKCINWQGGHCENAQHILSSIY